MLRGEILSVSKARDDTDMKRKVAVIVDRPGINCALAREHGVREKQGEQYRGEKIEQSDPDGRTGRCCGPIAGDLFSQRRGAQEQESESENNDGDEDARDVESRNRRAGEADQSKQSESDACSGGNARG